MGDDKKTRAKPGTRQALGTLDHRIIATLREPIIVLDGDLRVIFANDSFYRTFKVLRRWTEGRLIFEVGKRQWDISRLRILLENILLTDQPFQDFEVEHEFPKIGRCTMLLNARLLTLGDGTKDLILLAIEDVTERKRHEAEQQRLLAEQQALAEELAIANEELQVQAEELGVQAEELTVQQEELERLNNDLRSKQQLLETAIEDLESFSHSVFHDLKTPVRTIAGFSRMLVGEYADKLDAEGRRLLKIITDNTKLMHAQIDDLQALSRLGRMWIKKSAINLSTITKQVFAELQAQAPERDLRLTVSDLPRALGDQALLHQVIMNLLANAIKFTKSRKPAVIEVGSKDGGNETIYYVKDNGVGFDERYAHKLFGVFQRLQGGQEYEGNGVGLAIVQRIIHRHGGRVWAEGKVGEGATFFFALPKNAV